MDREKGMNVPHWGPSAVAGTAICASIALAAQAPSSRPSPPAPPASPPPQDKLVDEDTRLGWIRGNGMGMDM